MKIDDFVNNLELRKKIAANNVYYKVTQDLSGTWDESTPVVPQINSIWKIKNVLDESVTLISNVKDVPEITVDYDLLGEYFSPIPPSEEVIDSGFEDVEDEDNDIIEGNLDEDIEEPKVEEREEVIASKKTSDTENWYEVVDDISEYFSGRSPQVGTEFRLISVNKDTEPPSVGLESSDGSIMYLTLDTFMNHFRKISSKKTSAEIGTAEATVTLDIPIDTSKHSVARLTRPSSIPVNEEEIVTAVQKAASQIVENYLTTGRYEYVVRDNSSNLNVVLAVKDAGRDHPLEFRIVTVLKKEVFYPRTKEELITVGNKRISKLVGKKCPECGSKDINPWEEKKRYFICEDCGFKGKYNEFAKDPTTAVEVYKKEADANNGVWTHRITFTENPQGAVGFENFVREGMVPFKKLNNFTFLLDLTGYDVGETNFVRSVAENENWYRGTMEKVSSKKVARPYQVNQDGGYGSRETYNIAPVEPDRTDLADFNEDYYRTYREGPKDFTRWTKGKNKVPRRTRRREKPLEQFDPGSTAESFARVSMRIAGGEKWEDIEKENIKKATMSIDNFNPDERLIPYNEEVEEQPLERNDVVKNTRTGQEAVIEEVMGNELLVIVTDPETEEEHEEVWGYNEVEYTGRSGILANKKTAADYIDDEKAEPEDENPANLLPKEDEQPSGAVPVADYEPEQTAEDLKETDQKAQPKPDFFSNISPLDKDFITQYQESLDNAVQSGDMHKVTLFSNKINDIIKKYESPVTGQAIDLSSHFARQHGYEFSDPKVDAELTKEALKTLKKAFREIKHVVIDEVGLLGIKRPRYASKKEPIGTVDFRVAVIRPREKAQLPTGLRTTRIAILRVDIGKEEQQVIPFIWDTLGRPYRLVDAGFKKLFGEDEYIKVTDQSRLIDKEPTINALGDLLGFDGKKE